MNAKMLPMSELPPPTLRTNSIMKTPSSECVKYKSAVPSKNNAKRLFSRRNSKMPLGFSICSACSSEISRFGFAPRARESVSAPSAAVNIV